MSVASVQDVAEWIGWPVDDPQLAPVQRWLDATERRMRMRIPNFTEKLADADYRGLVMDIECTATERKLRNLDGHASESVDNVAVSFRSDAANGTLALTADEWSSLGVSSGVGVMRINPEPPTVAAEPWGMSWPF